MRNKQGADFNKIDDLRGFFHDIDTSFDQHKSVISFLFQSALSMFSKMVLEDIIHNLCRKKDVLHIRQGILLFNNGEECEVEMVISL